MNPQDLIAIRIVTLIITALLVRNWWLGEKAWRDSKKQKGKDK